MTCEEVDSYYWLIDKLGLLLRWLVGTDGFLGENLLVGNCFCVLGWIVFFCSLF